MPRKSSRTPRPSKLVMDELADEQTPWGLEEHLNGCLAGYQAAPSYGAAVFFALEALWGIAQDVGMQVRAGRFDADRLDEDWLVSPRTNFEVPWIWVRSLATAWEKYKTENVPLGQAFGLEGGGKGKPPAIATLMQMLDDRGIARWVWSRVQTAREAGEKIRIEDVVQEAAEKFGKSDVTVRRAWQRFGQLEKLRTKK